VIPGCDLPTTVRRANQIRKSIASRPIQTILGEMTVTVSMGVIGAESSTNLELLLRNADAALYRAKHNGRNRVEHAVASAAAASGS
jgi:diguanylate cyclase (GGDEF)-like protein